MWAFYIAGAVLVIGSYINLVPYHIAMIGWGIGMLGFLMQFVKIPDEKRF